MTKFRYALILVAISLIACNNEVSNPPTELKCEQESHPINIDKPNPAFSWQFTNVPNGFMQSAYQVLVASGEKLLSDKEADYWNSGKINSSQSQFILYSGKKLEAGKRYYWAVQIFDSTGIGSGFSQPTWFETGLLKESDWKALWIKAAESSKNSASELFRKEIKIEKKLVSARMYATGLNAYSLTVNGQSVGNQRLSPGWTLFQKRIQYQVYDLTPILHAGINAIGVVVGDFWNGSADLKPVNEMKFIAQLKLNFEDGSEEWLYSGKDWQSHFSPVLQCSYDMGEKYDARLEISGWDQPGFNSKDWKNVLTEKNTSNLVAQDIEPLVVKHEVKPLKFFKLEDGRFVADMGETLPGWAKIQVKCKAGRVIKLRYLATFNNKENKIGKVVGTDEYTCKGSDKEEWQPAFSYQVFRYIEISGLQYRPDPNTLSAILAYPDMKRTGYFYSSNELINKIFNNLERTARNNLVSTLTGLPDKDSRMGSAVSVHAFAASANYFFDMNKSFNKYMNDLCDLQLNSGRIQFLPDNKGGLNSPGWPDVMVVLPWQSYVATGDKRILSNFYEAMNAWHNSQVKESDATSPPYMHDREGNGDLFSLDSTRIKPISSCYYFYSTSVLSNIAEALGKQDDATSFMELAGFTKDQFNQSYLTYRRARYWSQSQTAHVLPLAVGLTPLSHTQKVADYIASDIKKRNNHLSTGILTTQFLLPLLSENKHHKLAYQLITQTSSPSWGYMVEKGSSTIWGSWDGNEESSRYQLALASSGQWLFEYLAGIRPDSKFPGFKHSIIDPAPVENLKFVSANVATYYGRLSADWKMKDGKLLISLDIPANTWSTVMLPVNESKNSIVKFGEVVIMERGAATEECPAYIKFKGFDADRAVFDVGSGKYELSVE